MDIMELGAIGELVGGVAVVASLVYVGLQLRHNASAVESANHVGMLQYAATIESLVVSDSEMADIDHRGCAGPQELSDLEWRRFRGLGLMRFGYWEAAYLNYKKGMIDAETWTAWDGTGRLLLTDPGYRQVWREISDAYAPTFQRYIDQHLPSTIRCAAAKLEFRPSATAAE